MAFHIGNNQGAEVFSHLWLSAKPRLEARACLEALLQKAPNYRLVESGVEFAKDVGTVAGFKTIPIKV